MQRTEIDATEFEAIRVELMDVVERIGLVQIIEGVHEGHGATILVRQAGRFFCDADDVSLVNPKWAALE